METSILSIKQRFEIIGNDPGLNRAIAKAERVAPTDITVLVVGESGVGKESIPRIIHQYSHRKHNKYIAVNCGAIPEGTIDSELFGHEKGAFTGATTTRKGYFEVADGGTIFLDEVGELPLTTQVRLLRVLENGEFIKVGSSQVQKTNVRIVAATNVNMQEAIAKNKFREDLYYRLSTIEIDLPPLRDRKEDINLLFRKFAVDFAKKYNMPTVRLDEDAQKLLQSYSFPGNIRQLRNIAEQISVVEENRNINAATLINYLPNYQKQTGLPAVVEKDKAAADFSTERDIMYKILFDMRKDLNDLKKLTHDLIQADSNVNISPEGEQLIEKIYTDYSPEQTSFVPETSSNQALSIPSSKDIIVSNDDFEGPTYDYIEDIEEEKEPVSLQEKEIEMIKKSLEKNKGKRKLAAKELGISERTLYRKIKQYDL